jgi:anti-anti-sigma factor
MTAIELTVGDIPIIKIKGRLDIESAPRLEQSVKTVLDAGAVRLVIDCSEMEYVSSPGIRILLVAAKHIDSLAGRFALVSPRGYAKEILRTSGIPTVVPMPDTEGEALKFCRT